MAVERDVHKKRPLALSARIGWLFGILLVTVLVVAACQTAQTPEAAAPEATAEPAEEAAAPEATEEPMEEAAAPEATAEPEEEAAAPEATAEPMEEPMAMGDAEAGEYIFNAAVGCGCHFNRDLGALAGGNTFEGDFGAVTSRNLTPHDTGIGQLSDQELADAIRLGKRVDGQNLFIMPHYSTLADQDVMNLIAYLRSQDPVENEIPDRELTFEVPDFVPQQDPPAEAPTEPVARGQYLASLVRCSNCHTPSNEDGSPNMDLFLAGAPFRDTVAPNLTPDDATGLGPWSEEEIADFLATGIYSDGTEAHGGMKGTIDRGISKLTDEDRLAIAAWLKSLPPIENLP
jgi:cytochrome c2